MTADQIAGDHRALRALVLAHEPDGVAGQIERRLIERGFTVDTHIVTDDYDRPDLFAPFPDFGDYDLIVPMGSVRSLVDTSDIDNWIHIELDLLRSAHEAGTPILGVCFGGQLMARALGGAVEVAPVTEIGWYELDDGDMPSPVGPGPWMEWHHDRFEPPSGATVLARNANAEQLFRIGNTVGTQFHPEVDVAHVKGFLDNSPPDYLAEVGVDPDGLLAEVAEHEADNIEQCNALVDWFLEASGLA